MQVSTVFANVDAKPVTVDSVEALAKLATQKHYSLGTFRDNYRNNENFIKAEAIGLDFDEGLTLEQAKKEFRNYKHAILPSKSHQKEKNGTVCDRFRVILFLSKPITDLDTYYATWQSIADKFPAADPSCKDPARQYYKSPRVEVVQTDGMLIDPVATPLKPKLEVVTKTESTGKGELSKRTIKFLLEGAPKGKRHAELYFAARDMHEQGYSIEECKDRVQLMAERVDNWETDYLSDNDVDTIESAYSKDPRHEPRITQKAFEFKPIGELLTRKTEVNWLVEGLLTIGGLSLVAGPPKSGKSTLVRQLAKAVSRGEEFLGRKVVQGPVLYLALEEQEEMLNADFQKLGVTNADPILVHVGGALTSEVMHDLDSAVAEVSPSLVVIDTFALFANVRSLDNYAEINPILARIRKIARDNQAHVLMIHHSKKSGYGASSILGSQAIHGAVDNAISFNQQGSTRFISTSQRGGRRIDNVEAVFDSKTNTYSLGKLFTPGDEF